MSVPTDVYTYISMDMHMYICSCITMGIYTCTCTCALHVRVCTYFHPFEPRPARGHFDSPVLREAVIFARAQRKTTGSECDYYGCFTIALRCESASHLLLRLLRLIMNSCPPGCRVRLSACPPVRLSALSACPPCLPVRLSACPPVCARCRRVGGSSPSVGWAARAP